ncbi:hemin uptake protein HemP [Devosia rhizoryzae]|uniref:Hemin uptake protein HemP n=1 Tax=Devosia rhizoryzae TaxID=2774137 RepID=A0ABX7C1G9_9HYPH|nr:hemin uptake protein HemP [Devosia rhizoryzae]QQR38077.1 hemin uptake protein HemP [Devosia rhizoryzae]
MSDSRNDHAQPRSIPAEDLFQGATEVIVWHAGVPYRLRVTRNDKLILTK